MGKNLKVKFITFNEREIKEIKPIPFGVIIGEINVDVQQAARKAKKDNELKREAEFLREKIKGATAFGAEIDMGNPDDVICAAYHLGFNEGMNWYKNNCA